MNSRQRRKQRRFRTLHFEEGRCDGYDAGLNDGERGAFDSIRTALGGYWRKGGSPRESVIRGIAELHQRTDDTEASAARARGRLIDCESKLRAAQAEAQRLTDDARKFEVALKRQTPLVAELQIALRQIAAATSILGATPDHGAVDDVPRINELRQRVLATLKGKQ